MLKTLTCAGTALAIALACAPGQGEAQTAPAAAATATVDADPALWVVKDADTTIYLFGTVHVLKPGLGWFDEGVKAAFDASDQVMLEILEPDEATMQQLLIKMALNPTGPTVTEQLPESKRAAYAAAMASVDIPAAALDRFDPWLPAITLAVAKLPKLGYDPDSGAEKVISAAAKTAGKQIGALETAEQQLGYFDGLPQPVQIRYLVTSVEQIDLVGPMLDKMVASWSAGDPDALAATMNEAMRDSPEVGKVLLTERNARWAEWVEQRLARPGTVFVAVGAGHLAGGDSVQAFLAKRNLKAVRVQY